MLPRPARFAFLRLSIKQRLPLLIGTLLFGVIVASAWASYHGVKQSALEVGQERLHNVTRQLAALFQQSASNTTSKTLAAANDPVVRAYLRSPLSRTETKVATILQQFAAPQERDGLRIEVWRLDRSLALALPETSSQISPMSEDLEKEFKQTSSGPSSTAVGAIRVVKDMIVYPIVAVIKDESGQPVGFLVRWRRVAATPEARQQFVELIGTRADLYIGNAQGDVWTDLVSAAPQPPADVRSARAAIHYTREGKSSVIALGRPVNGTPWFILVELSDQAILGQADRFLRRMALMGFVLLVIGVMSAWALSRSITWPLQSLTEAASAIAGGDYSRLVEVKTRDELGALAIAFNIMVEQVRDSEQELEQKIQQRTLQLEAANRDLESFSYSVSHDLRAPLRSIDGFSRMLLEESAGKLNDEEKSYLERVHYATQEMEQLIDDLLRFALAASHDIRQEIVDLTALAQAIVAELQKSEPRRVVSFTTEKTLLTRGDKRLLQVMLNNLLGNAWKFTSKREKAEIAFGQERKGDATIYFVRDNGAGFDMRYESKLFGVFQRLHSAHDFEGTGVGLATVQRIVLRHGGRIWAEGEVDQGATFYFTLGNFAELGNGSMVH